MADSFFTTADDGWFVRLTVDLSRSIPMAGFRIKAEILRVGRAAASTAASIVDRDGVERVRGVSTPRLADAVPGPFPIRPIGHGRPAFSGGVELRYPPGEDSGPGALQTLLLRPA